MKLAELVEKINIIELQADLNTEISDVCYDSRKVKDGTLFVAVSGFETDGHKYIQSALDNGCAAVVCERIPDVDVPYILVENSRLALALLSCAFCAYPADKLITVGITGTSGKTTSTQLIKHVIEEISGEKVGLIGTNGNFIGKEELHTEHTTPESLELQQLFRQMVDEGCKYVVMEVSSHALTLSRVAGFSFNVSAFTNLSQDHLDFHKDMDDYAAAKKTIFRVSKVGCINLDDSYSEFMLKDIPSNVLTTSVEQNTADILAQDIKLNHDSVTFTALYNGQSCDFKLGIPGLFSVYNALTVISVCLSLGFEICDISKALSNAHGVTGRMETLQTDGDYSIIRDYSHKPDPLEKVLKTLRPVTRGRLVVLFGCGGDRDRVKRPIMGRIAVENADVVIVTSDNPRTEVPGEIIKEILVGTEGSKVPVITIEDRVEAIRWAVDNAQEGDVILLAGKGHEDYQVIGHEKHHMDEKEIVAEIMKERKS